MSSNPNPYGDMKIVEMIGEAFISPNERDRRDQDANVVDGLFAIARSIRYLAEVLEERKPEQVEKPTYRPGDFR